MSHRYRLFSHNRFNLISFYDTDYGDRSGRPLEEQINQLLYQSNIEPAGHTRLFCYPRVLGFVFNPLSIYYCFRNKQLIAVVYEVSNTFRERHSYVIPAETISDGSAVIRQTADKQLACFTLVPDGLLLSFSL